jgi:GNAT superfamily N-acetyltransferase
MPFELTFRPFPAPDGPLRYALVPWDSEAFGCRVYDVRAAEAAPEDLARHLPALCRALTQDAPCLLVTRLPASAVASAEPLAASGFYPVETQFEIYADLARFKPPLARRPAGLRLRRAAAADLPQLVRIGGAAFRADRFHLDPHLPDDKADARYAGWVARGLRDGDDVFLYEDTASGAVVGFFHTRIAADRVDLSLAAIEPAHQRLGIGLLLYQDVLLECRARGCAIAESRIAAGNLGVLNLFVRLGFSFRSAVVIFHRYFAAASASAAPIAP